jgi:hypothetical protein
MLCPELLLLPLDGETIAFSEATQHLFSLNPTAALVVEKLQKGRGVAEIAQILAERGLAAPEQALEWVDATLAALKEQTRVAEAAPLPADPDQISDLLPYAPFKAVTEQRYCLLETCALIRYEAWAQKRLVDSVLGHLATDEPRAPTVVIELKAEKRANYTMRSDVYRDGVPIASARGLSFLGPIVKGAIWQSAVSAHDFFFYIHAGVVGTGTNCVLLPAAAGSGKSSLTMALVHRGFQYFSDEVALIEPGTFRVPPMPLAMAIKEPGWELAGRYYPALESLPAHVRSDSKVLRYLPPPGNAVAQAPSAVRHIIFPTYQAGVQTKLVPLRRAEALGRLMDQCLGLRRRLNSDNVRAIVDWMRNIDCYELTHSCLDAAVDAIVDATGFRNPFLGNYTIPGAGPAGDDPRRES